jgi:ferredoxin
MYKIVLRPSGQIIEIDGSKNLLEALREKGIYIKSSCGGVAACSDCIIRVVGGEDNLEPPPFKEISFLGNVFHITKERLACQTRIHGDVVIDISGHDEASDQDRLKVKTTDLTRKVHVRKRADIKIKNEEREKSKAEKAKKDAEYFRHWENEKRQKWEKKLGGSKRPKIFNTDKIEEFPGKLKKDDPKKNQ